MQPIPWSHSLRTLAQRFGDRLAVTDSFDQSLTYHELDRYAHHLAIRLGQLGVVSGEPVGVLLPNSCVAVWVSYGIRLFGACETPMAYQSTEDELKWFLGIAGFKWLITSSEKRHSLSTLGCALIDVDELFTPSMMDTEAQMTSPGLRGPVDPNGWGRLMFTSGTTGKPKGVVYLHQARFAGEQLQKATLPFVPQMGDRIALMTPFIHGASLLTYAWCDLGGTVVLLKGIDLERLEPLLRQKGLVAIFAPPTVLAKLVSAFEGQTFEGIKCIFTGTQPLTRALYEKAQAMFGPVVRITFGKSECVNPITVLEPAETHAFFTSSDRDRPGACVGWPAPGVEVRITAPDLASGEEGVTDGEIQLRGPQMSAFLLSPDGIIPHEAEGWHATGDLGYWDDRGRLVLTGRIADVIKTGGYRVNPDEIEAVVSGVPESGQICITSLPSDYWGEIIVAVAEQTQEGWVESCQSRLSVLSKHKQPRLYVSVASLPRNPQGKISRRLVRATVLNTHTLIDGPYPQLQALDAV